MKLSQLLFSFLMGFFCYSLIEIVMRGYTHWTMSLTGGLVLMIIYIINSRSSITLFRSCIAGTLSITAIELTVGIFDNVIMRWNVWDYSDMPFNFLGQICIPFSCLWFVLCIPASLLCRRIGRTLNRQPVNKKAVPIGSEQPL